MQINSLLNSYNNCITYLPTAINKISNDPLHVLNILITLHRNYKIMMQILDNLLNLLNNCTTHLQYIYYNTLLRITISLPNCYFAFAANNLVVNGQNLAISHPS